MRRLALPTPLVALAAPALAQGCEAGLRPCAHATGETCVSEEPRRIASLHDIGVTLSLVELGAVPVGSHGRADEGGAPYSRTVRNLFGVDFDDGVAFVGPFNQLDLEAIAAAQPDLIIRRPHWTTLCSSWSGSRPPC